MRPMLLMKTLMMMMDPNHLKKRVKMPKKKLEKEEMEKKRKRKSRRKERKKER
jgi:hypothetical protein